MSDVKFQIRYTVSGEDTAPTQTVQIKAEFPQYAICRKIDRNIRSREFEALLINEMIKAVLNAEIVTGER